MFKVNNENTKTTSMTSSFGTLSSASIVDFQHVNVSLVMLRKSTSCPHEESEPVHI